MLMGNVPVESQKHTTNVGARTLRRISPLLAFGEEDDHTPELLDHVLRFVVERL